MNDLSCKIATLLLCILCPAAGLGSAPKAAPGAVQLTMASDGAITVRFSLPEKLAVPPWDLDTLADHGFSLEKYGSLPYLPVRPVTFEINAHAVSTEILKSEVVEVPDVIRQAGVSRQPSAESEILLAPTSGRPIPLAVFPESALPTQHVVVDKPVMARERVIVRVRICPFARDERQGVITRADMLVFRLAPLRLPHPEGEASGFVKGLRAKGAQTSRPLILNVPSDGIYRVSFEDLSPWWGEDPLPLSGVGLTCRGQDIAYYASGDGDDLLEPGESILFYGAGGDRVFTGENAYWLSRDGVPLGMQSRSQPPPGEGMVTHLPRRVRFEENHLMHEGQPPEAGEDYWHWVKLTAPEEIDVEIDVYGLADSPSFQAELRVGLQGATSSHKTRVTLNGTPLVEEQWEGFEPKVLQAGFSQPLLQEGTNTLVIEELGEGEGPDIAYLSWVEVRYDAEIVLYESQIEVTVPPDTPGIIVSGLPDANALVFDVTEVRTPDLIEGFVTRKTNGTYQAEVGTLSETERRYVILSSGNAWHPSSIRQRSDSTWSDPGNGADWMVIAPAEFLSAARTLASHRESQGLRTVVADVQDVYDEFNHAVTSPEAVRDFVSFAYRNWEAPAPRYLVLFGDGHLDYMDWFGTHQPNFILPHYSWIPPLGWAPNDGWFGCVEGDDVLPEVYVGRLPVRSPDEAATVVGKVMDYEVVPVPQEWQKRVTFCASAGDLFEDICRTIAKAGPPNFEAQYLFRDDVPDAGSLKEKILESLSEGTWLYFYVGHGSVERWSESVFHVSDVPSLTNAGELPVMCMLTCLSGYFSVPWKECLAEELVRASNGGAAGCIAPTGLGYPSEHLILARELIRRLFAGITLGQCLGEAKVGAYARGLDPSFLRGFGLLGDPATAPRFVPATPDMLWFY